MGAEAGGEQDFTGADNGAGNDDAGAEMTQAFTEANRRFTLLADSVGVGVGGVGQNAQAARTSTGMPVMWAWLLKGSKLPTPLGNRALTLTPG